jgi:hypothetical protein
MIIIVCNDYGAYERYVSNTVAQSNAMSKKDFVYVCKLEDVEKVMSVKANEVRIISPITYLDSDDWFDITRRIR